MSEETTQSQTEGNEEQPKTFTQEQVNAIVKERLARAKAEVPTDYEELKEKAAKYDEAAEAEKTEMQRLTEERDQLAKQVESYAEAEKHRTEVAEAVREHKLSPEDAQVLELMNGDVAKNAEFLAGLASSRNKYPNVTDEGEANLPAALTDEQINSIADPVERVRARAQAAANKRGV